MIAEAGLAALWLAAALAALQLVVGAMGVASGRSDLLVAVRPIALVQAGLTALARPRAKGVDRTEAGVSEGT